MAFADQLGVLECFRDKASPTPGQRRLELRGRLSVASNVASRCRYQEDIAERIAIAFFSPAQSADRQAASTSKRPTAGRVPAPVPPLLPAYLLHRHEIAFYGEDVYFADADRQRRHTDWRWTSAPPDPGWPLRDRRSCRYCHRPRLVRIVTTSMSSWCALRDSVAPVIGAAVVAALRAMASVAWVGSDTCDRAPTTLEPPASRVAASGVSSAVAPVSGWKDVKTYRTGSRLRLTITSRSSYPCDTVRYAISTRAPDRRMSPTTPVRYRVVAPVHRCDRHRCLVDPDRDLRRRFSHLRRPQPDAQMPGPERFGRLRDRRLAHRRHRVPAERRRQRDDPAAGLARARPGRRPATVRPRARPQLERGERHLAFDRHRNRFDQVV